jgi:signal transduction histidine kinase/ActR/RegA family two-component response regulator
VGRLKTRSNAIADKRNVRPKRRSGLAAKSSTESAARSSRQANRDSPIDRLGWWTLRLASTPLALVEGRRVAIGNRSFEKLARKSSGARWQRCDLEPSETDRPCRGLNRLLINEVAALAGAKGDPVTRTYRRIDQTQYLEASYWRSLGGGAGDQTVVMIQEATARVQAEQEVTRIRQALIQHERMRAIGELASGVAHDLNNTLHAMSLRLSLIEQSATCQTEQGSNIAALSRAINDAALVVGRLQDFARQGTDRALDRVDVTAVVGDAIEMVRTTIEGETSLDGAPVRIRTRLPALPPVTALASELRLVIVNLLLNARDALPSGGTIEVAGQEIDGRVILEVRDNGSGIPAADLENIFSPFFTTKGTRGTGLGLSNARSVLARLGGEISARNRPEGGACFSLSFPIASGPQSSRPERATTRPPRRRQILVIDDNLDNLQATKLVLQLQQQSVDVAQTGAEALARFASGSRYDLVLCDIGMPDMNGWRVAREIQKAAPGTTVYLLTGWAHDISPDDARQQWVKGILQKPMNLEVVRQILADERIDQVREPAARARPTRRNLI